jgi:hypothetical protein
VIEFARNASRQKALTPDELVRLGQRMLAADNKEEAERLRQELVSSFYGEKSDLCGRDQEIPIPNWHKTVLDERERQIAEGKATFVDWETAKEHIRKRIS